MTFWHMIIVQICQMDQHAGRMICVKAIIAMGRIGLLA